jgi:hypothetical protein
MQFAKRFALISRALHERILSTGTDDYEWVQPNSDFDADSLLSPLFSERTITFGVNRLPLFGAAEIIVGYRTLVALVLPVDAYNPPAPAIIKKLNAVDPAHKRLCIGRAMA